MKIRITGPLDDVSRVVDAIRTEHAGDIESVTSPVESSEVFDRTSHSMEPITYAVVAFSAHLAAALAHDLIRAIIKKKLKGGSKIEIKEE